MPEIHVNDIQMYYELHGEGEPLVLILGLGTDISEWSGIIGALAQYYKVIAFASIIPFGQITAPTLVLVGDADPIAARPEVLAAAVPRAQLRVITGDHLSAVTDPAFAPAIVEFLGVA